MIGTRSCCSSCIMAITLSPMTAVRARRKSENNYMYYVFYVKRLMS
jgi:hypothetical protein